MLRWVIDNQAVVPRSDSENFAQHLWSRLWICYNSFRGWYSAARAVKSCGLQYGLRHATMHGCLGGGVPCSELMRDESESKLLVEIFFPRFVTAERSLVFQPEHFGLLQAAWNPSQARSFGYFFEVQKNNQSIDDRSERTRIFIAVRSSSTSEDLSIALEAFKNKF